MFDRETSSGADGAPGFLHSIKVVLATLSSAFNTRVELFVTELEEERERLKQTLVLTLLVIFGLSLGFILFTIFLVAIFLQNGWIAAIGGLAFGYLAVGAIAALKLRRTFLSRSGLFPATLGELGKDRDRFKSWSDE